MQPLELEVVETTHLLLRATFDEIAPHSQQHHQVNGGRVAAGAAKSAAQYCDT